MSKNIEILMVEPGKTSHPTVLPDTMEAAEAVLGGTVQVGCFLPQRVLLVSLEDTTGLAPNRPMPVSIKNCKNHKSGNVKTTIQEMRKSQTNNTDFNNTDFNDTDLSINRNHCSPLWIM